MLTTGVIGQGIEGGISHQCDRIEGGGGIIEVVGK